MKRIVLGAALLTWASMPFAQYSQPPSTQREISQPQADAAKPRVEPPMHVVEAPKHQCGAGPQYPSSRLELQAENRRRVFERDSKTYETCMKAFIEERKAVLKANQDAATAAIDEFNAYVKKVNDARAAMQ